MLNILRKIWRVIDACIKYYNFVLDAIVCVLLVVIMVLVPVDVLGRSLFKAPIVGTMELTGFFAALCGFCAIGMATYHGQNIGVDAFLQKVPKKIATVINSITAVLSLAIITLLTYESGQRLLESIATNERSDVLRLPMYLIFMMVFLGYLGGTLAQVSVCVRTFTGQEISPRKEDTKHE